MLNFSIYSFYSYVADFDAPGCPQTCNLPPGNCPEFGTSENCLFLTVTAPTNPSADPAGYPVLFWMHGGAFEQGLGNCALYNGTYFALNNIVTVVINYRLGVLGFMAGATMEGNYGFLDQRLAMQWTQNNIAAFGGDPKRVTIAGQSAGAESVAAHYVSPKSRGLFSQIIMESNPMAIPFHTRESGAENANAVSAYVNCAIDDLDCLRTKSVDEILEAQNKAVKLNAKNLLINFLPFAPMIEKDGEIPQQPLDAMMQGNVAPLPTLAGTMYDEGQLFVYELFTKPMNEVSYRATLTGVFGAAASKELLRLYPFEILPGNDDGRVPLNYLATDLIFYCPLRNATTGMVSSVQSKSSAPTFIYRLKHVLSFDCWGPSYTFCVGVVCHGSDLPFVFNVFTDGGSVSYEPTADELALANDMVNAWSNFITSGNPNTGLSVPVAYPAYEASVDSLLVLEEPGSEAQAHARQVYCDTWDKLGYFY